MAAHDYHLITHWRVRSSLEEVYGILINPRDYPRWWPEVFLRAQEVRHGDAVGASRTARFNVRGYLPYSLWFQAEVVEARFPFGFTTEVNGDFNGRGIWTFQKAGPWVFTTFDWRVRVTKPLIRLFSFLVKPLFASNHYWVMGRGEQRLQALLRSGPRPAPAEPILRRRPHSLLPIAPSWN